MVSPSGPAARELPLLRMARATVPVVKGDALLLRGHLLRRSLLTRRVLRSLLCGVMDVNCLLKAVAISRSLVSVRVLKVMGWLGGGLVDLPERDLIMDQKCGMLCLCEHDSTESSHFLRLASVISFVMVRSSSRMEGWLGVLERILSR